MNFGAGRERPFGSGVARIGFVYFDAGERDRERESKTTTQEVLQQQQSFTYTGSIDDGSLSFKAMNRHV